MKTLRLSGADPTHLAQAGEILRTGGLTAIPTETVYGLAANAADEQAVARIFSVKGRPADNPLIVHLSEAEQAHMFCEHIPLVAADFMRRFWPGPLTLVMRSNGCLPRIVTAGLDTVALRCPAHPVALALLRHSRCALAAPSANLSGKPSPTTAAHVLEDLDGRIDAVVDGGACTVGLESTVLDCTGDIPLILRQGGLTREQLREYAPQTCVYTTKPNETPRSPGLRHRHYAPQTPLTLLFDDKGENTCRLFEKARGERFAILCYDELMPLYEGLAAFSYGTLEQPESLAAGLFDALRRLDASDVAHIYAHCPDGDGLCAAVRDRLLRAAGITEADGRQQCL